MRDKIARFEARRQWLSVAEAESLRLREGQREAVRVGERRLAVREVHALAQREEVVLRRVGVLRRVDAVPRVLVDPGGRGGGGRQMACARARAALAARCPRGRTTRARARRTAPST